MSPSPPEFTLIARHFRPLAAKGALNLEDDAALLTPPPGRTLVLTADTIVEGVHYLPTDPPDSIGQKLLRVSLSDLAAMGATPLAYLMTVSAPRTTPDSWFAAFARGLAHDQAEFAITLLGGDTTSTPGPTTLSLTAIGHVAPDGAIRRAGAGPDDEIWVTGTIGDGAMGLLAAQHRLPDPTGYLTDRYRRPQPRLNLLQPGLVTAAMDVSDGLVQDIGHLARAAGLAAHIQAAQVPLSQAAQAAGPQWLQTRLTGGDDYELVMTIPPGRSTPLQERAAALAIPLTRIGHMTPGQGVTVFDPENRPLTLDQPGWSHF